jgi:DMSO/TMAO reductase YedYZ heme-binding membrane subunit
VKADLVEPMIYATILAALLAWRIRFSGNGADHKTKPRSTPIMGQG